jgi:DNA primase
MVSKDKQIWHCFGCNDGGDVIIFVQKYEGLDFIGALRLLADKAGVVLENVSTTGPSTEEKNDLWQVNQEASGFWQKHLQAETPESSKTKDYLTKRGIKPETITQWGLGLSGSGWDELYSYLKGKGFSDDLLVRSGLVSHKDARYFDRFRERLMFPIADIQGKIAGFTARTLAKIVFGADEFGGKYINSPQTPIYNKSFLLYGLDQAKQDIKKKDYVIVVEGNMDVIMSHQMGIKNVVAVSGTALTGEQLRLIKRFTNNIILAFDSDAAGSQALYKSGVVSANDFDMNVKALVLAGAKDPADIILQNPDDWKENIKKSVPIIDFYFEEILRRVDLSRADHKKIAIKKLLDIMAPIKSAVERDHYLRLLASRLDISAQVLTDQLTKVQQAAPAPVATPVSTSVKVQDPGDRLAEGFLAVVAAWPEGLSAAIDKVEPEVLPEPWQDLYKRLIIYYTKNQSTDFQSFIATLDEVQSRLWSQAVHIASDQYADLTAKDLEQELQSLIPRLKVRWLKDKMRLVSQAIEAAEATGDRQELDRLTLEFTQISSHLASYLL